MARAARVPSTKRTSAPVLTKTPTLQPRLRALTQFDTLPPGHTTLRVCDDASAPHLKEGEFAVIDITDREVQHGELFVIQYEGGLRKRHIVQVSTSLCQITRTGPKQPVWWVRDLRGFRQVRDDDATGIPVYAGLSDGPYLRGHLQAKLLGRVVGYSRFSFGNLLAPEAGWENEDAGNAAFDPAEYLDVLIATGHKPYVMRCGDGSSCYYEIFPERAMTDAQHAAVHAVRVKYCEASTANARVCDECIRRGLIDR